MCWWLCWLWSEFLVWQLLFKGVVGLRLVALNIPDMVTSGDHIQLSCIYRLEGDQLYSIKWYKDDMEFFRFVPRYRPNSMYFPLPGIKIDIARSLNGSVYIKDVDFTTSGIYRCEISADAPSFQTVSAERPMLVKEYTGSTPCANINSLLVITLFLFLSLRCFPVC